MKMQYASIYFILQSQHSRPRASGYRFFKYPSPKYETIDDYGDEYVFGKR